MDGPFSKNVIDAVVTHMNDDHAEDCLLLVRALGGLPAATAATMTSMDPEGLVFEARLADGPQVARVAWPSVPTDRADVRRQVVVLHELAAAAADPGWA